MKYKLLKIKTAKIQTLAELDNSKKTIFLMIEN